MKRQAYSLLAGAVSAMVLAAIPGSPALAAAAKAKVAIVIRDTSNPYWRALRDGAIDEGKKLGVDVTVQAGANETDIVGENAKISTMANQDYTCFGVVPINGTNVITPLLPVSQKGIPIINLDTALDAKAVKSAGLKLTSFIGSDNVRAGKIAGEHMLSLTGGKGDVALLLGIPGEQNGINRETAFRAVTKGKLHVVQTQVADYERAKGLSATTTMLKVHPHIVGIFSANDEMGLGAAQAISNAGKSGKIKVISVDGEKEAIQSVKAGKLSATVSQYPYAEGQMAVQACQAIAQGKKIPTKIESPIKLITPANADQVLAKFPQPFFSFDDPFGAP